LAKIVSAISNLETAMATLTSNYNKHTHSIRSDTASGTKVVKSIPGATNGARHKLTQDHSHGIPALTEANKTTVHSAPVNTGENNKKVTVYSGTMPQNK